MENDILWTLVDEIEAAFKLEGASLSGKDLCERVEATNSILRTAWPVMLKKLEEGRASG